MKNLKNVKTFSPQMCIKIHMDFKTILYPDVPNLLLKCQESVEKIYFLLSVFPCRGTSLDNNPSFSLHPFLTPAG